MSRVLKRLSTVGVAAGTALVLAAGPAAAGPDGSISASEPGTARALTGASTAGALEGDTSRVTGAAAASVGFRVYNVRCFSNAVVFNANTFENGRSGVQRFQQRAQLQEFAFGAWRNRSSVSTVSSTRFPNDFRSFNFNREWRGTHAANGASWRVKWQGFYLNGFGGVIARTNVITATCY